MERRNMDIHAQHWANEESELYHIAQNRLVEMFEPAGLTYEGSLRKGHEIRA